MEEEEDWTLNDSIEQFEEFSNSQSGALSISSEENVMSEEVKKIYIYIYSEDIKDIWEVVKFYTTRPIMQISAAGSIKRTKKHVRDQVGAWTVSSLENGSFARFMNIFQLRYEIFF